MAAGVLVLGGGLAGLYATLELVAANVPVVLVEQGPVLGGKRAARLGTDPELDPRLAGLAEAEAVELLTLATLVRLEGEAGRFVATISQRPRYVTDACTRCTHCVPVCPQAVPNEYDAGLTVRKAIHTPLANAIPPAYVVDIDACLNVPPNYLPCQRCVAACDDRAIHFDMPVPEPLLREIGAVIVATGFADHGEGETAVLRDFGYGEHPDVVSSVELQRLLEDPGPSGGFAVKPSDENYPESVLLVLTRPGAGAAWVMANQLRRLVAQDLAVSVLVLAADTTDPLLQPLQDAAGDCGVSLLAGSWLGVEQSAAGGLDARYVELPAGRSRSVTVDMVVLSSEVRPDPNTAELCATLGLATDAAGYPASTRPGIFVVGGATGAVGVATGAKQASEAVRAALQCLGETAAAAEPLPWAGLPATEQQRYLEDLLLRLVRLGGGAA